MPGINSSRAIRGALRPTARPAAGREEWVWSEAPFMFRNELVPVDRLAGEHPAHADGVKRLGDNPVVTGFVSGGGGIGVAARAGCRVLVTGLVAVDVT